MHNYLMLAALLTVTLYMIGVANWAWTSPLDIGRRIADGHRKRRSADVDTDGASEDGVSMSTCPPEPGDPPAFTRISPSYQGPRPLEEIRVQAGLPATLDDDDQDDDGMDGDVSPEARKRWVAARLRDGDPIATRHTRGEWQELAAEIFDCSTKTVRRDTREAELAMMKKKQQ